MFSTRKLASAVTGTVIGIAALSFTFAAAEAALGMDDNGSTATVLAADDPEDTNWSAPDDTNWRIADDTNWAAPDDTNWRIADDTNWSAPDDTNW
jgi:hypothetical protein